MVEEPVPEKWKNLLGGLSIPAGASGIQVGSTFALTEESGMKAAYRTAILNAIREGRLLYERS